MPRSKDSAATLTPVSTGGQLAKVGYDGPRSWEELVALAEKVEGPKTVKELGLGSADILDKKKLADERTPFFIVAWAWNQSTVEGVERFVSLEVVGDGFSGVINDGSAYGVAGQIAVADTQGIKPPFQASLKRDHLEAKNGRPAGDIYKLA